MVPISTFPGPNGDFKVVLKNKHARVEDKTTIKPIDCHVSECGLATPA